MTIAAMLIALFVALATTVILLSMVYYTVVYVPYVPAPLSVVKKMVEVAKLREGQTVIDLGCGDARLLSAALEKADIKAIGYDVNWMALLLAKLRFIRKKRRPELHWKNFHTASLQHADVVYCYLFPKVMEQVKQKCQRELRPGAQIISYSFPIKGWKPEQVIITDPQKPKNFLIYQYRMT